MKLTETELRKLKTPTKTVLLADNAVRCLYVRHSPTGRIVFVYRARHGTRWEVATLGKWPEMSLAAARKRAGDIAGRKNDGGAGKTFGELLDEWYEHRIEPRYKVTKNIETYVARGKDALGNKQLSVLATVELVAELKRYAKDAPVAANRCLSNWKLALDYAVECGYLEHNPLARTTARVVGGEEKTRDRVLTDEEIRKLWSWKGHNASLMRFLLLTGLRISEGQHGRQDGSLWRVDTSKNGKAHWVHLPPLALEQIEPWEHSPTAAQSWIRRQVEREGMMPFTPHDLRRTCATRMNALGVEPHIVERVLNHTMQGVMGVYNKWEYPSDRIEAAEQWATALKQVLIVP